jgi:exonuclease SbcC
MLLERLTMTNFKRFRNTEIHFQDGITGIIGNNGAGKSSIVEAILFALYGVKGSGVNSDYIISSFADPHDFCEVRLDFLLGGFEYTVYRKFKKGSHDVSLFFRQRGSEEPLKELAKSVNEVGGRIQEILGMGAADFRNTIYAAQKDLLSLIDYQPHARREWFMRALGIEHLKNRSDEILKERIDQHDEQLRAQRVRLETLETEMEPGRLDSLKDRMAGLKKREEDTTVNRAKLQAVRESLEGLKTTRQALEFARERFAHEDQLLEELASDGDRLKQLEEPLERSMMVEKRVSFLREREPLFRELSAEILLLKNQVRQKRDRWHEVMDELDRLYSARQELGQINVTLSGLEAKRDQERIMLEARSLTASIKELVDSLQELQDREKSWEEQIKEQKAIIDRRNVEKEAASLLEKEREGALLRREGLSTQIGAIRSQKTMLEEDFNRVSMAGPSGTCPLCHQELGEHFERLDQEFKERAQLLEDEENRIISLLLEADHENTELGKRLSQHRKGIEHLETARLKFTDLSARRDQNRTAIEKKIQDLDTKQRLLERLGTGLYDPVAHQALRDDLARLEVQSRKADQIQAGLTREPDLLKERDRLVGETADDHAGLKEREKLLQENGYDDAERIRLEEEFSRLRPIRDEVIGIMDRLSRQPEIKARRDRAFSDMERLSGEVKVVQDRLVRSGWPGVSYEEIQHELRKTEDDLRQLSAEKAMVMDRIQRIEAILAQTRALKEEAGRLQDRLELLRMTRKMVADYIVYLMQVVRSQIEGDVGGILSEITAGRYERVLIDEDFGLLVRDIDNDYPVERFSGGEQDDIAVALRIALSRYLAALHQVPENTFLIFDEIFGSQDEERRNNLLLALRSIESHFPQILLISHIPEMQGEFSHTLLVELGSDQASRIQEVNQ